MCLIILRLILAVGTCRAAYWQTLTCPYELRLRSLRRVWCRQSSPECCRGLIFSSDTRSLDGGRLKVAEGPGSFTMAVQDPGHGEGLYWCGLLSENGTIIKLAEGSFHSSASYGVYDCARWILLPVTIMTIISIHIYIWKTAKQKCKKAEEPRYENAANLIQLE